MALGIEAGDYARVEHVDTKTNQVMVRTDGKRTVSYDSRRLQGVTLYRETERAFATGDRVQMTAPDRDRGVANRELGAIERIGANGRMEIRCIYTDDKVKLARALDRDVSHTSALARDPAASSGHAAERHVGPSESRTQTMAVAQS